MFLYFLYKNNIKSGHGISYYETPCMSRILLFYFGYSFLKACLSYLLTWPRGNKTFFMLNSVEHVILDVHKYKKISRNSAFLGSDKPRMLFFPLINVKMPTLVGILTFMSSKNFMLS